MCPPENSQNRLTQVDGWQPGLLREWIRDRWAPRRYLNEYKVFDETKCPCARQCFIQRIYQLANNSTGSIIRQGGLDFDSQPGGRTNGRYRLGYEYILEDAYSGTLQNRPDFQSIDVLLGQIIRSETLHGYKLRDLRDCIGVSQKLLKGAEAEMLEREQTSNVRNIDTLSVSDPGSSTIRH